MPIRPVVGSDTEARAERARRLQGPRPADGSAFARHLQAGTAAATGQPAAVSAPALLASLLDTQEIDSTESDRRRQAATRAHAADLLDRLDELHLDLLEGRLSGTRLKQASRLLAPGRERCDDANLEALVDAIETRLEVELAKYARK